MLIVKGDKMKKILTSVLLFILVLSGCQASEDTKDETATMVYETEKGEIEYPSNPTIYADYYVGQLLYLDADVLGADMTYPAETWTSVAEEQGVENIAGDMEAVAALTPELIVTMNPDYYDQYSAIAPTILIPYGTYDQEEIMLEFGKILDKEAEAKTWVEEFNTAVDEISALIDHPEYTIGIAEAWDGTAYMYGENYARGGYILYNKLGLEGTEAAEEDYVRKDDSYLTVDGENLTNYAGDVFFIMDSETSLETIKSLPTYNNLEAVKNNRVVEIDYDTFLYDDPYSLNAQIKALKEIYESEEL